MPTASARIDSPRPARYLRQLCRHAEGVGHRGLHAPDGSTRERPRVEHVEIGDTEGILTLDVGRCVMRADADALTLRVESPTDRGLRAIQELLAHDLERFGRREGLTVTWEPGV